LYRLDVGCRMKLLEGAYCPDLNYLISVVDLLATCAEVTTGRPHRSFRNLSNLSFHG